MISIIVPTFNRGDLISQTIISIINQSYLNWEILIIDDHSTDNTKDVVDGFMNQDNRIYFLLRPHNLPKGANSCRNFGLLKSKGKYIKWMDSDDVLVKDCLSNQVEIMTLNPNAILCLGYSQFFDNNTGELEELWSRNYHSNNYFSDHIVNKIRWHVGGLLWRRSGLGPEPFYNELKNSQEWLMHSVFLLSLDDTQIYNYKTIVCHVRRGHDRMSSSRSSIYYLNQVKARIILLFIMIRRRKFRLYDVIQLLKQSIVYSFYSIDSFLKGAA
jgi:glycosyltransferase involved in cell wall biosynthesis